MTPGEFRDIWTNAGDTLIAFPPSRLLGLGLEPKTMNFLMQAGLPIDAAPFLSFVDNSENKYKGIVRLTDQYDFLEEEFKKWIVIGSCSDGDPIAINVQLNDQIDWLDHDNYFEPGFFNSSIEAFAECLVICRDFATRVNRENGDFAFIDGNFGDDQFDDFRRDLLKADKLALCDNSFWNEELEMYLAMRDQFRMGA
jgi:hypothetical protein